MHGTAIVGLVAGRYGCTVVVACERGAIACDDVVVVARVMSGSCEWHLCERRLCMAVHAQVAQRSGECHRCAPALGRSQRARAGRSAAVAKASLHPSVALFVVRAVSSECGRATRCLCDISVRGRAREPVAPKAVVAWLHRIANAIATLRSAHLATSGWKGPS